MTNLIGKIIAASTFLTFAATAIAHTTTPQHGTNVHNWGGDPSEIFKVSPPLRIIGYEYTEGSAFIFFTDTTHQSSTCGNNNQFSLYDNTSAELRANVVLAFTKSYTVTLELSNKENDQCSPVVDRIRIEN